MEEWEGLHVDAPTKQCEEEAADSLAWMEPAAEATWLWGRACLFKAKKGEE